MFDRVLTALVTLTIITKAFILDVAAVLDPPLVIWCIKLKFSAAILVYYLEKEEIEA